MEQRELERSDDDPAVIKVLIPPVCSLFQMEKKKQENKMRRDQLNDEYLELLDKQRLYFKTVKDFKEVRRSQCWLQM